MVKKLDISSLKKPNNVVRKPRFMNGKTIFMHRIINNTPEGMFTDHINRNKLDNRKENLRTVTEKQNKYNRPVQKNNSSGYAGVHFDKNKKKWCASISINNKTKYLGRYINKEDAIFHRKLAERLYYAI